MVGYLAGVNVSIAAERLDLAGVRATVAVGVVAVITLLAVVNIPIAAERLNLAGGGAAITVVGVAIITVLGWWVVEYVEYVRWRVFSLLLFLSVSLYVCLALPLF